MSSEFTRANRDRLHVFPGDDGYRFRAYFDEPGLFATLRPFYDGEHYRFEVPAERFEKMADLLRSYGYEPVVVEDPTPFVVAYKRFRDHPRVLFQHAVERRRTDRFTLFLLDGRDAVEAAVEAGAIELAELDGVEWRRR